MTGWGGEFVRWGLGGALVLAAHVGAGFWLVQAAERGEIAGLPDAIAIDLAPAPAPEEAPAAAESPEAVAGEAEPVPDFTPPDFQELPPVEDFADLIPDPVSAPDFQPPPLTELPPITDFAALLPESALLLSASERPMARPPRRTPEPQRQQTRQEPQQQEPQRQAEPARQSRQVQQPGQVQRKAGGGEGQRQGNPAATARQQAGWQSQVRSRIVRQMSSRRIRGSGHRGQMTVTVRVSIAASGATSARLVGATGDARVDSTLAGLASGMPNMPAPPNGRAASFDLPIRIQVN